MIFYGKTFNEKVIEAKGRKYDTMKRHLEEEIRRLEKELKEVQK